VLLGLFLLAFNMGVQFMKMREHELRGQSEGAERRQSSEQHDESEHLDSQGSNKEHRL